MIKWVALTTLIAAELVQLPSPVLRVSSGLLRGRLHRSGAFYQYFGVPYGTVDKTNRFKDALPPPKWKGEFDAIDENTWCPQRFFTSSFLIGHPDCLKLNIYAPVRASNAGLLPVMVFIHGGYFFEGIGSRFIYGGDYFVKHNVVFVGINYRIGTEGFLCLGIKEAPGNIGLKDQIVALKWIKNNIKAFGGNPDNVSVFGNSAGASAVGYLMLSPAVDGLFHKAIVQSGASTMPRIIQYDPIDIASILVKEFGCDTKDPYKIYDILSSKTHFELISALKLSDIKKGVLFGPCIESKIKDVEPIMTESPLHIINSGNYTKVPMIIGYNDMEGIYLAAFQVGKNLTVDIEDLVSIDLLFPNELEKNVTVKKINDYYFSSKSDESSVVDLYSDFYVKFPMILNMELYARTTEESIYYYLFQYSGYRNFAKFITRFFSMRGASHGDEIFYMMQPNGFFLPEWFDRITIERMVAMWTNFAKYGEPTPVTSALLPVKWLPSREWNPLALVIDSTFSTAPLWNERSASLWNDTYNKYRRTDYGLSSTRT